MREGGAAGFRWDTAAGAWAKVEEEMIELREALASTPLDASAKVRFEGATRLRVESELGDLFMATAFFASYVGLDPESACRSALRRFEDRFRRMEAKLGAPLDGFDLAQLMQAWENAKEDES
jgi:uncharacterized protein YabN with tetrapyrrole methylase and pyrophosphatase domain